ncbi:MAG TPA: hypothetical protein VFK38_07950 [Candidatus Limnocylindrales bacterium]|nr:hypothetical protein [Candidatus Limnocylindrales bacterium]
MTAALALIGLLAGFGAAFLLLRPAVTRLGLGIWHPAVAWLSLEALFFAIGAPIVAGATGRPGPALYVAAFVAAFGLGVAASDALARSRIARASPAPDEDRDTVVTTVTDGTGAAVRPLVAAALAGAALVAVLPTLLRVGIPFLTGDVTGARVELTGLPVQLVRVALPAAAAAALLAHLARRTPRTRLLAWGVVGGALLFEILLASRYLPAELLATLLLALGVAGRRLPWRGLALVALLAATAFAGVQVLRASEQASGRELAFAVERTVNRVLLIQPRTLDALQQAIPAEQPHFGGLTWLRRLGPALGQPEPPNLGYWIYPRLFPAQTPPGYLAPGLVGEAWANLGAAGLGLPFLLGVAVERLGALVALRRRGPADVIAGALAILFVARTHALGVNGLLLLALLVAGWRLLAARLDGLDGALVRTLRWRL